jgi:hypothetical protein
MTYMAGEWCNSVICPGYCPGESDLLMPVPVCVRFLIMNQLFLIKTVYPKAEAELWINKSESLNRSGNRFLKKDKRISSKEIVPQQVTSPLTTHYTHSHINVISSNRIPAVNRAVYWNTGNTHTHTNNAATMCHTIVLLLCCYLHHPSLHLLVLILSGGLMHRQLSVIAFTI